MSTQIFIDKENGETGTTAASKDRMRLHSAPSKAFVEKTYPRTPLVGRTANVNSAAFHSVRKVLGNLNKPLSNTMTQFPKEKKFSGKKATEKINRVETCSVFTEDCAEKENMFPYNPLDFDSFEVPEEHRLSHLSLTGVPLMTLEKTSDTFTSTLSVPTMHSSISWDYDILQSTEDYLATLDEIIIDLPPPL